MAWWPGSPGAIPFHEHWSNGPVGVGPMNQEISDSLLAQGDRPTIVGASVPRSLACPLRQPIVRVPFEPRHGAFGGVGRMGKRPFAAALQADLFEHPL